MKKSYGCFFSFYCGCVGWWIAGRKAGDYGRVELTDFHDGTENAVGFVVRRGAVPAAVLELHLALLDG